MMEKNINIGRYPKIAHNQSVRCSLAGWNFVNLNNKLNGQNIGIKQKTPQVLNLQGFDITWYRFIVGMAGFEPAASTSQMWRDTGLRYIPIGIAKVGFIFSAANIFLKNL
jgi:hypothetical protein